MKAHRFKKTFTHFILSLVLGASVTLSMPAPAEAEPATLATTTAVTVGVDVAKNLLLVQGLKTTVKNLMNEAKDIFNEVQYDMLVSLYRMLGQIETKLQDLAKQGLHEIDTRTADALSQVFTEVQAIQSSVHADVSKITQQIRAMNASLAKSVFVEEYPFVTNTTPTQTYLALDFTSLKFDIHGFNLNPDDATLTSGNGLKWDTPKKTADGVRFTLPKSDLEKIFPEPTLLATSELTLTVNAQHPWYRCLAPWTPCTYPVNIMLPLTVYPPKSVNYRISWDRQTPFMVPAYQMKIGKLKVAGNDAIIVGQGRRQTTHTPTCLYQ